MECERSGVGAVGAPPPPASGPGRPSPDPTSDLEVDEAQAEANHSSEEELEAFNCREREKRKWSQVKRTSRDSSCCSSDEEMSGVLSPVSPAPVQFRATPPADAHKPGRDKSPPRLTGQQRPPSASTAAESPGKARKRQRGLHTRRLIQRPCLDLEKMQQEAARSVTTWRPTAELSLFCW